MPIAQILPLARFTNRAIYFVYHRLVAPLQTQNRQWVCFVLILALVLLSGCRGDSGPTPATNDSETDPVASLQAAVSIGDWPLALERSKEALIARPDDPAVLTDSALAAAYCGNKREAASLLVEAARLADYRPDTRVKFAVQALIDVGEVYAAIDLLEQSLAKYPDDHAQRRMLVGFLNEVQLTNRLPQHLQKLIEDRQFDLALLVSTTETSSRRLSDTTADTLMQRNPNDYRVLLSRAFLQLYRRDASAAASTLQMILEHHPDFAPAYAMYGQALAEDAQWDRLEDWLARTPSHSSEFADYWLTLGDLAAHRGDAAEAARAYWEATRRDPNRLIAWDRLLRELQHLQAAPDQSSSLPLANYSQLIANQASQLLLLGERFNHFAASGQTSQTLAAHIADSLYTLGRTWEAEAWSAVATTLEQDPSPELASLRTAIVERIRRDPNWFALDAPGSQIDLSSLPVPTLAPGMESHRHAQTPEILPAHVASDHLRLRDRSLEWGLKGVGQGNCTADGTRIPLTETTASGAGAIDYDLDGRPDLIVVNAAGTMLKADSNPNQLLRNLDGHLLSVTQFANVGDRGYGQGVAVGDFDEDGFPDLFVTNLGTNRLLRNNGDGTFADCSDHIRPAEPPAWSTSAAFADINGDSLTDLVVTRYCELTAGIDQPCTNEHGTPEFCHPLRFPAMNTSFHLATQEGKFQRYESDVIASASGHGLGVLVGALSRSGLDVYVANDMSRNTMFSPSKDAPWRLVENALTRGVAVDGRSQPQASMGIAASDWDLDGDLDLYVTGFAREYNIFYEQTSPGIWSDETRKLNLIDPTLMMVGFGAQALDIDADGIDEIVVTNGHIGDFADPESPPFEQPLQIFRRGAQGTFLSLDLKHWGGYFAHAHVGRGLLKTDINQDGHTDIVVTHSHEQIRLLVNESLDTNHGIAFKLVGTESSRDAVGAVLSFAVHEKERSVWRLSGDGYLCSNESILQAGIGPATTVTDVRVTWQDGSVDSYGNCAADAQYVLVQGTSLPFMRSKFRP